MKGLMQRLYTISVFLNNSSLEFLEQIFSKQKSIFQFTKFEHEYESGDIATGFEIAFTFDILDEWNTFVEKLSIDQIKFNNGDFEDKKFALLGSDKLHGTFHFIFDKRLSEGDNFSIEGEVGLEDYNNYCSLTKKYIAQNLANNIHLTASNNNQYKIQRIQIPWTNNGIVEIDKFNNDIGINVKDNLFTFYTE